MCVFATDHTVWRRLEVASCKPFRPRSPLHTGLPVRDASGEYNKPTIRKEQQ